MPCRSPLSKLKQTSTRTKQRAKKIHLAVSGTPGTGKTALAKLIAKRLGIQYISLTDLILAHNIADKYDRRAKTYDVSVKKLELLLRRVLFGGLHDSDHLGGRSRNYRANQSYVLDSHLSHLLSAKLVDVVIVCRCDISVLNRRLIAREYSKQKVKDNMDAEIFNVCATESMENGHPTLEINCSKKTSEEKIKLLLRQLLRQQRLLL